MWTFLEQTVEALSEHGFTAQDVRLVYTAQGRCCTWDEFVTLADFDNNSRRSVTAGDLYLQLRNDMGYFYREESDPVTIWRYLPTPSVWQGDWSPIQKIERDKTVSKSHCT